MAAQWFIQHNGTSAGPFYSSQLIAMAATGLIMPHTLISRDRTRWVKASSVKGLTFPSDTRVPDEPRKPPKSHGSRAEATPAQSDRRSDLHPISSFSDRPKVPTAVGAKTNHRPRYYRGRFGWLVTFLIAVALCPLLAVAWVSLRPPQSPVVDIVLNSGNPELLPASDNPTQDTTVNAADEAQSELAGGDEQRSDTDQDAETAEVAGTATDFNETVDDPAGDVLDPHDPVVARVFSITSDSYTPAGFQDIEFGMSRAAVIAKVAIEQEAEGGWAISGDHGFYFEDDHLRAYTRLYRKDPESTVTTLKTLFGEPRPEDTFTFETATNDSFSGGSKRELLLIQYHFPRSVVYIQAAWNTYLESGRIAGGQSSTQLYVFDRQWLMSVLDDDIEQKRRLLVRLRELVELATNGVLDWDNLPSYPDTRLEQRRTSQVSMRLFLGQTVGDTPHRSLVLYRDLCLLASKNGEGHLGFTLYCYQAPDYSPHPQLSFQRTKGFPIFRQDVIRCNAVLAQEFFPVEGSTLKEVRETHGLNEVTGYAWNTKNNWAVGITAKNRFFLGNKPDDVLAPVGR